MSKSSDAEIEMRNSQARRRAEIMEQAAGIAY